MAFGLVGFTVAGVALVAPIVFGGFDWRLGLVLGAIVAPTDAIAAAAIAQRVGLPRRISDTIGGESLVNDATGLLALQFAIAILVQKQVPTVSHGITTLVWLTAGGIGMGLLVGVIAYHVALRISDPEIQITLSILIPYAAYLAAQSVHASGVLAVVSTGLFLSQRSTNFLSPSVRIRAYSVWDLLNFVLNGLVFVLIGLQLPTILASIQEFSGRELLLDGAVFSIVLIVLRLVWVFPGAWIAWLVRNRLFRHKEARLGIRHIFVVGWTGMRGVVCLAAALALPAVLPDGSAFPHRNLIVFLAFSVICVTLVLQGITLPPLIRALGLSRVEIANREEQEARRMVIEAVVAHLIEAREKDSEEAAPLYDELTRHYLQRLATVQRGQSRADVADRGRYLQLLLEAVHVQRETAVRLRNESRINDEVLRHIEQELDLSESRLTLGS